MKSVVLFLAGIFLVLGCSSAVKEVEKELVNFKCSKSDFAKIDGAIKKNLTLKDFRSSDKAVFQTLKNINSKLANECPLPLLKTCSAGSEADTSIDSIKGPANSFGISGSTEFVTLYQTDEFGVRLPYNKLIYSSSISEDTYKKGMACYSKNTQ